MHIAFVHAPHTGSEVLESIVQKMKRAKKERKQTNFKKIPFSEREMREMETKELSPVCKLVICFCYSVILMIVLL